MDLNDELKKCLIPLNWMTAVSGCRLIPSQKHFLNLLDRIQAVILILCYSFTVYETLLSVNDFVFIFRKFVYCLSCVLFILILRKNVKKLRSTTQLFSHLKPSDVRKLLLLNWTLFSLKAVTFIHLVGLVIPESLAEKNLSYLLSKIIILYGELNAFVTGGFCLYLFYVLAISFAERNIMDSIMEQIGFRPKGHNLTTDYSADRKDSTDKGNFLSINVHHSLSLVLLCSGQSSFRFYLLSTGFWLLCQTEICILIPRPAGSDNNIRRDINCKWSVKWSPLSTKKQSHETE